MNHTRDSLDCVLNSSGPEGCGVLSRDGVFYALLPIEGQETPMVIALHGVSDEFHAREALRSLLPGQHWENEVARP